MQLTDPLNQISRRYFLGECGIGLGKMAAALSGFAGDPSKQGLNMTLTKSFHLACPVFVSIVDAGLEMNCLGRD